MRAGAMRVQHLAKAALPGSPLPCLLGEGRGRGPCLAPPRTSSTPTFARRAGEGSKTDGWLLVAASSYAPLSHAFWERGWGRGRFLRRVSWLIRPSPALLYLAFQLLLFRSVQVFLPASRKREILCLGASGGVTSAPGASVQHTHVGEQVTPPFDSPPIARTAASASRTYCKVDAVVEKRSHSTTWRVSS